MGMTAAEFVVLCKSSHACAAGLHWLRCTRVKGYEPATAYFDAMLRAVKRQRFDGTFSPLGYLSWSFCHLLNWPWSDAETEAILKSVLDEAGCTCSRNSRHGSWAISSDVFDHLRYQCTSIPQETAEERAQFAAEVLHRCLVRAFK